jgi:hypothetical protein
MKSVSDTIGLDIWITQAFAIRVKTNLNFKE